MKDHRLVFDHIDAFGETSARRLFSNQLVDEAQRLSGAYYLVLGHTTRRSASATAPARSRQTTV